MKIVPIIEFTVRNTTVFVRHIHVAAASINDAMAKYNDWTGKRDDSESFVINEYETLSNVADPSGKSEGQISIEDYQDWKKRMTESFWVDNAEYNPLWLKIS